MVKSKGGLISDKMSEEIVRVTEEIAMTYGAQNVTVRRVLAELGVTNRVFYNRFHNIDEVLEIVYKNAVIKMHESVNSEYDLETDFFNYVIDVAVKVLIKTYEVKRQFSQYMFEHDSLTEANRIWWTEKIKTIIEKAKATNQMKDVDSDMLSYAVWCFFRGYNADAVHRKLSVDEAVKSFKFGLDCLFYGIAPK